jgi:hypothetical protein
MARHDMTHYVTIKRLKELLEDKQLTEDMLILVGKVTGDLVVCRPGATKEQECTCIQCRIGEIDLADEEVNIFHSDGDSN